MTPQEMTAIRDKRMMAAQMKQEIYISLQR